MPKPEPYNPFTDEVVLERLKKSPVEPASINDWKRVILGDTIAMAWMVGVETAAAKSKRRICVEPISDTLWTIEVWKDPDPGLREEYIEKELDGSPLRVLADTWDWLEAEHSPGRGEKI